jgi:MFS family permease
MLVMLRSNWALLLGILLLMMGSGLQSSLLPIRAALEVFPTSTIGLILSAYYAGYLLGWALVPGLIARVGHIRVFAAMGSLVSISVLLHAVFVDPTVWFIARMLTGASLCGIFMTTESWLNSNATNEIRGQLLATYMVVLLGGLSSGPFLLNLSSPQSASLFITVSILVSLAIIPMLLSVSPAPAITTSARLGLKTLFRLSPLGTVAIFCVGVAQSGIYGGVGTIYGRAIGLSIPGVSLFMSLTILGGMLFQWPVGWLSDRFDRRKILTLVTFMTAICAFLAIPAQPDTRLVFALFFLVGGFALPLYSLCVAHANDFMTKEQMVGASGALLLINGVGSVLGPGLSAYFIGKLGAYGFPLFIGVVHAFIGGFALWRMTRRAPPSMEAQGPTIPLATPTPMVATIGQDHAVEQSVDDEIVLAEQSERPPVS